MKKENCAEFLANIDHMHGKMTENATGNMDVLLTIIIAEIDESVVGGLVDNIPVIRKDLKLDISCSSKNMDASLLSLETLLYVAIKEDRNFREKIKDAINKYCEEEMGFPRERLN